MIEYDVLSPCEQKQFDCARFKANHLPDGSLWSELFKRGSRFIVRFPTFADFSLDPVLSVVECTPVPGVAREVLDHFFNNAVVPLMWSARGGLALHASGISFEGRAIAFAGPSGRGKSTLAAFLTARGFPLICDDSLLLNMNSDTPEVYPGPDLLRLWEDSARHVFRSSTTSELPFTTKGRYQSSHRVTETSVSLHSVYFLTDQSCDAVDIQPLKGTAGLLASLASSFVLDHTDRNVLQAQFGMIHSLHKRIRLFSLSYPREYNRLPEVLGCLVSNSGVSHE